MCSSFENPICIIEFIQEYHQIFSRRLFSRCFLGWYVLETLLVVSQLSTIVKRNNEHRAFNTCGNRWKDALFNHFECNDVTFSFECIHFIINQVALI